MNTLDRGNGISRVAYDLAVEQARRGWAVSVITQPSELTEDAEGGGVTIIPALFGSRKPVTLVSAGQVLAKQIRVMKPDILHAHTSIS